MSAFDNLHPEQFREWGARDQLAGPQGGVSNGGWKPSMANTAAAIYSTKRVSKEKMGDWLERQKRTLS